VWRIRRAGSLDRLARVRDELADPRPAEARVRVAAVGLNFADLFACLGLYSATPKGAFVPGLEFAGTVEAVGASAPGPVRVGDQVFGLTRFGAYATAVTLDARYLWPVPPGWSLVQAAAFPVQALTAWYGLVELGGLGVGEAVLLHSAAGGVGLNALAILAARQARVVATVGGAAKRDFLLDGYGLRSEQIIVRDRRTFAAQLDRALAALGMRGFDVVFDAIGGPFFRPGYDRLLAEGRYVVYGAADFMSPGSRPGYLGLALKYLRRPRLDPLRMMAENKSVLAFNLIWLWERVERLAPAFDAILPLICTPPAIGRRFGFADAPQALRYLQRGENIGKVVLEV